MRFTRYTLRTTNADAARDFYSRVLGHANADIVPLHEQALKRGAQPHWLGVMTVDDVDEVATQFVSAGGDRLGPTGQSPAGGFFATVREAGGALVGLSSEAAQPRVDVVWHVLNTRDLGVSAKTYESICGWVMTDTTTVTGLGVFHNFAWSEGNPNVGSMAPANRRPGIHTHWLFQIRVPDLDASISAIRSSGGTIADTVPLATGERVVVADDPQGAAFSLRGR